MILNGGEGSFVGHLVTMLDDETVRGIVAGGLMALLTIPAALVGQVLKLLPDSIMDPERIPPVMALVGLLAGVAIGHYSSIPMDLAIAVGTGAGLGSKIPHDEHRRLVKHQEPPNPLED